MATPIIGIPTGTILPFYGNENQLPTGFLFCNGDPILLSDRPALYNHLVTANPDLRISDTRVRLPDLRGEFIRGWDNGRGVDRDRVLGSAQEDMMEHHSHHVLGKVQFFVDGKGEFRSVEGNADRNINEPPTSEFGGSETRPRNVAVNFIIKY